MRTIGWTIGPNGWRRAAPTGWTCSRISTTTREGTPHATPSACATASSGGSKARQQPQRVLAADRRQVGGAEAIVRQPFHVILAGPVRVIRSEQNLRRRDELRQR